MEGGDWIATVYAMIIPPTYTVFVKITINMNFIYYHVTKFETRKIQRGYKAISYKNKIGEINSSHPSMTTYS